MFIISTFHNHCTHQAITTNYLYKVNQTSKHIIMLVSISWSLWLSFVKWHDNELPRQSIRQQSMKPLESITSTKYPATRTSMSCQTFRSLHLPALNKEQIIIVIAIEVFNQPVHKTSSASSPPESDNGHLALVPHHLLGEQCQPGSSRFPILYLILKCLLSRGITTMSLKDHQSDQVHNSVAKTSLPQTFNARSHLAINCSRQDRILEKSWIKIFLEI